MGWLRVGVIPQRPGTGTARRSFPGTGSLACLLCGTEAGSASNLPAGREKHLSPLAPAGRALMAGRSPLLGTERTGPPLSLLATVRWGSRHHPPPLRPPGLGGAVCLPSLHDICRTWPLLITVTTHGCPRALVTELIAHHFKPLPGIGGCLATCVLYCSELVERLQSLPLLGSRHLSPYPLPALAGKGMGWAAVWNVCWLFKPQPAPSTGTPNVISKAWDRALTRTLVRSWEGVWKD